MRNSLEQHPTNGKTLDWFEKLHTKGKLSEERLKYEAQVFFKKDIKEDKKVVKKKLLGLVQKRNNLIIQYQRKLQKELGGLGKNCEKAPSDFGLEINEEKRRNSEIVKMCRADVRNSAGYLEWLEEECNLLVDPKVEILRKIQAEIKNILDTAKDTETVKIVRERSSGPMIADTEKTVLSQNKDGSLKKNILKGTFANVTIRPKSNLFL